MGRGEEHGWIVGKKRLLRHEVLHPCAQDRAAGSILAEGPQVRGTEGPLPDEPLVAHSPRGMLARGCLAGLRQREGDPAHVVPAGHAASLARTRWERYWTGQ